MWVGLVIMKMAAPIYFDLLQSTDTIIPTPIKNKKRKANFEEDLLAGGTEDCDCPRLDGYKVQKP